MITLSEKTTIAIDVKIQKELNKLRKGRETYNDVLRRLIHGISDVFVEFVLVDNELPQSHTIVFQLGEDTKSLYFWDGQNIQPITVDDAQKLLKQPKPNMTLTKEEIEIVADFMMIFYKDLSGEKLIFFKRIEDFLAKHGIQLLTVGLK